MENGRHTEKRGRDLSIWPRYEAAVLGFRNYWYPVTWSRDIGSKPRVFSLLGDPVMLRRENGKVYAFYDQCPHRGIPLSVGRQEFPGTWTCRYHGWTYENETGVLKAALTDGPDSPICGKVRVKTYPVEERAGLVWIWMGEGEPSVPVEADIPEAFLREDAVIVGRVTERRGNWRYAAENGFDDAHAKYLHRYGIIRTFFRAMPAWGIPKVAPTEDGAGVRRTKEGAVGGIQAEYPSLGLWPPKIPFWKKSGQGGPIWLHLPSYLCSQYQKHAHYEWYVPVDKDHYRYLQFLVTRARDWNPLRFRLRYWLYDRWLFHVQFNNQDGWMVELMPETAPERLFRPDVSITAWRRLCEHARGETLAETALPRQLEEAEVTHGLTPVASGERR